MGKIKIPARSTDAKSKSNGSKNKASKSESDSDPESDNSSSDKRKKVTKNNKSDKLPYNLEDSDSDEDYVPEKKKKATKISKNNASEDAEESGIESAIEEYFFYQEKYEKEYGPRTILLYQMGDFYETYEYNPQLYKEEYGLKSEKYTISHDTKTSKSSPEKEKKGKIKIADDLDSKNQACGKGLELHIATAFRMGLKFPNKCYCKKHCHMTGGPINSYEIVRDRLLEAGYVVVRFDEVGELPNGRKQRKLVEIVTPATCLNYNITESQVQNYLVSMYIEMQKPFGQLDLTSYLEKVVNPDFSLIPVAIGLSAIDLSTGKCNLSQSFSSSKYPKNAYHEAYRFILSMCPKEFILHIRTVEPLTGNSNYLEKYFDFLNSQLHINSSKIFRYVDKIGREKPFLEFLKPIYQDSILEKVYSCNEMKKENMINKLGLAHFNHGVTAFTLLLQHCYTFNPLLLKNLSKPDTSWSESKAHLQLSYNALLQLNIISDKNNNSRLEMYNSKYRNNDSNINAVRISPTNSYNCLLRVLDNTETAVGTRYLEARIKNPICNPEELNTSYNNIDYLLSNHGTLEKLVNSLRAIADLEKLHRKIYLSNETKFHITPNELHKLLRSYLSVFDILEVISKTPLIDVFHLLEKDKFNKFIEYIKKNINLDVLKSSTLDRTRQVDSILLLFNGDAELKKSFSKVSNTQDKLAEIVDHLNTGIKMRKGGKGIEISGKKKKLKKNEEEFVRILGTKARIRQILDSNYDKELCGILRAESYTKTKDYLVSDIISDLTEKTGDLRIEYLLKLNEAYFRLLTKMIQSDMFRALERGVAEIDFLCSGARCALKYKHYRPVINLEASESAYLHVKEGRHPLIEYLHHGEFVANNFTLGCAKFDESEKNAGSKIIGHTGIVLHGLNYSGKSSLLKMAGILVVMAQAGLYVPGNIVYRPFTRILTRLTGGDDLLSDNSQFSLEMNELDIILKTADKNSLVLADELCHSTEVIGAQSLSAAAILELVERKSPFLMSSHFHQLSHISEVAKLSNQDLGTYHLSTHHDAVHDVAIYDRKLQPGAGDSVYAILVAKSMQLDKKYIDRAESIRKEIEGMNSDLLLNNKKSNYSNQLYSDKCSMCGSNKDLHTHHLVEQHKADADGKIGYMSKNVRSNLMILCQNCHQKLHREGKRIIAHNLHGGQLIYEVQEDNNQQQHSPIKEVKKEERLKESSEKDVKDVRTKK